MPSLQVYRRLLAAVMPYKFIFFMAIVGNILYGAVDSSFIYLFQPLLDEGFVAQDRQFIIWAPFIIVAIFVFRGIASFLSTYCMGWVGRRVVMNFRQQMFSHLLVLPTSFYDNSTSGEILSKITYNVEQVADACSDAFTVLVRETFTTIGLLVVMLLISWQLTCMFFFIVPVMAGIIHVISNRLRRISSNIQNSIGSVTHVVEEAIEGQRVIKAFGGQAYERSQIERVTEENNRQELKLIATSALSIPLVQFVGSIVLAGTVYMATLTPSHGLGTSISPGGFAAFVGAMIAILRPIKLLTKVNANIQKGIAGAASIFSFLDEHAEKDSGTKQIGRLQGNIKYQDVSFCYEGSHSKQTLQHISFHVNAGETIALVGRSGSGKSTLVNLLPRFYDASGEISIDGINIFDMPLEALRRNISMVTQQVVLFNDTILNNIAYGMKDASFEDVVAAAKSAHALEFIEKLPKGFHTMVGENGVRLSGGQRQRLAIARAILKRAPILILDEATSALDTESERKIQDALENLMSQSTTLVIAHRLSTVENADRIIVMDEGKILEMGTHAQLMGSQGLYSALREMQYQELIPVVESC